MTTAGLLLTGGASRRMGRDKGNLPALESEETLAERTGRLLGAVAHPALEIGPGFSHLPAVSDVQAHAGPLAALADGAEALAALGHDGYVLVVATDLPHLRVGMLRWLAQHPFEGAVVPLDVGGHLQPLCARYRWRDLERAQLLVSEGQHSLHALLDVIDVIDVHHAPSEEWLAPAGDPGVLEDVDTPEDLVRARSEGRHSRAAGSLR